LLLGTFPNYIRDSRYKGRRKTTMEGIVKKWMSSYGFIATDETQKEVFVHVSDIQSGSHLKEGTKVKFDLAQESRGPKAVHVEIIE